MVIQKHLSVFHIIYICANLIHSVGRLDGYYVVRTRLAEHAIDQVDSFVGAIAEEDAAGIHALDLGYASLQVGLQRVGIAVIWLVVWVLVCVEKYVSLVARVLITRTAIGRKAPYIRTDELLELFHLSCCFKEFSLTVMAFLCASSISCSAIISTARPMERIPCSERVWNVILR